MPSSTKMLDRDSDGASNTLDLEQDDEVVTEECNVEGISTNSGSRIVVEKISPNSFFGSKDPLLNGVYLYEGSMTNAQIERIGGKFCSIDSYKHTTITKEHNNETNESQNRLSESRGRISWMKTSFLNIFFPKNNLN